MKHTEKQLSNIGLIVAEKALEIFEKCGAENDFCVQYVGGEHVIFGGTNRVGWSLEGGFKASVTHCTERFLIEFDKLNNIGFWGLDYNSEEKITTG